MVLGSQQIGMNGCLFCSIVKKDIPAEVIFKNDGAMAFLDIHPMALGHTLVIPKRHGGTILDLSLGDFTSVFEAVREVEQMIIKFIKPDGFTLGVNQGKVSGQEIDHFHFHVVPRFNNDGGGSFQAVVRNAPKESIKEIADKLKKNNGKSS